MLLLFALIFTSGIVSSINALCTEELYCTTFTKEAFDSYCASFLKIPCAVSCGKCAADDLKSKFSFAFDVNQDGKITFEEGSHALKQLGINPDDASVTEIKDVIFDSKAAITDLYTQFDTDKNDIVTAEEFVFGSVGLLELVGIPVSNDLKQTMKYVVEIARVSHPTEIKLPKLTELLQSISTRLQSYPHGLVSLVRLQKLSDLDLERSVIPSELDYGINGKVLIKEILEMMDLNGDRYVDHKELAAIITMHLELLDVDIPVKVYENIQTFFGMLDKTMNTILSTYGYTEVSQLVGVVVPQLGNQPFVDGRIKLTDVFKPRIFTNQEVMRYLKSASNAIPYKKFTIKSIIETVFSISDKSSDGGLDKVEFGDFALVKLPRVGAGLADFNQALKVMKLFDYDKDERICKKEFMEMMKPATKQTKEAAIDAPSK